MHSFSSVSAVVLVCLKGLWAVLFKRLTGIVRMDWNGCAHGFFSLIGRLKNGAFMNGLIYVCSFSVSNRDNRLWRGGWHR